MRNILRTVALAGTLSPAFYPQTLQAQSYDTWTLNSEVLNSAANYTTVLTTAHREVRKYITGVVFAGTLLANIAGAQTPETSGTTDWDAIRSYLERNPEITRQLTTMISYEITPETIKQISVALEKQHDAIFNDPISPVLGNPDGTKIIVKFSDFNCGYCKSTALELETFIAANPDVKVIIKEFPILGADSLEAAKFALAVKTVGGNFAYARIKKALFESNKRITMFYLEDLAKTVGLDPREVIDMMDSEKIAEHLSATSEIAESLRITGTPGLIIGGQIVRGSVTAEILHDMMNAQQ